MLADACCPEWEEGKAGWAISVCGEPALVFVGPVRVLDNNWMCEGIACLLVLRFVGKHLWEVGHVILEMCFSFEGV